MTDGKRELEDQKRKKVEVGIPQRHTDKCAFVKQDDSAWPLALRVEKGQLWTDRVDCRARMPKADW